MSTPEQPETVTARAKQWLQGMTPCVAFAGDPLHCQRCGWPYYAHLLSDLLAEVSQFHAQVEQLTTRVRELEGQCP